MSISPSQANRGTTSQLHDYEAHQLQQQGAYCMSTDHYVSPNLPQCAHVVDEAGMSSTFLLKKMQPTDSPAWDDETRSQTRGKEEQLERSQICYIASLTYFCQGARLRLLMGNGLR